METNYWLSPPANVERIFFYGEEVVFKDFSILQMVADTQEEFTSELIVAEINRAEEKTVVDRTYWLFSCTGPEPDTRIARYYKGCKNSLYLGRSSPSADLHENFYAVDNQIWWYGLHKIDVNQFNQSLWSLFGLSRHLVLIADEKYDLADTSQDIFMSIWNNKKSSGQTRYCVPEILKVVTSTKSKLGLVNGYGSEDFGGFFINVFLPKHICNS